MRTPSLRRALVIRCGIGIGMLLCFLSATIYLLVRQSLRSEIDRSITQTAALLANQVELENGTVTFEWQEGLGSNPSLILESLFQFWDNQSGETTRSPALRTENLPKFQGSNGSPLIKNIVLPNGDRGRAVGLEVHPFILPGEIFRMKSRGKIIDPESLPHTLVVARNIEPIHRTLDRLQFVLATGSFLMLALGFTLIDHAIRVTLRPIDDLTRQMRERTEHQLDFSLTLPGTLPSELTGLARNFDFLLSRVSATRQREKDFIRHAAHELRTPIAGLRATTDLALSQPRNGNDYAEYLEICRKSAVELGELVNRLSSLSRIGQTHQPPHLEPIHLEVVLEDCLKSFIPLINRKNLKLTQISSPIPLCAMGDLTLVQIVINNLLDNASAYTAGGRELVILTRTTGAFVEMAISNPAENLPADLNRLFEPLFRREVSRYDANSHLGIGLTLSLEAAQLMNGSLRVHLNEQGWIEFVFGLPSAEIIL